jgi:hypothetical protein
MIRALAYKEFRETIGIAAIGLVAFVLMSWWQVPRSWQIPFVSDGFVEVFSLVAFGVATTLGLRQTIGDFLGDAQLFLLHRPVSRRQVYATKLLVGAAVYLVCALLPLLLRVAWAAAPATHASPFEWSMTASSWVAWISMTANYFGGFLMGIRPAAWFGTRLAPLVAALIVPFVASFCWIGVALLLVLVADALFITAILAVADSREFA